MHFHRVILISCARTANYTHPSIHVYKYNQTPRENDPPKKLHWSTTSSWLKHFYNKK
jgi:hypothetical protein